MNTAPFFIVGSGRSGTTLLRMILTSHSRLTVLPETWFLLPLLRRLGPVQELSAAEVDYAVRTITNHYRWPDMKFPTTEFRCRVHKLRQPVLRDIVEVIYQKHIERDNKRRWGDKTPGYMEVVPQLAQLFLGSRFIHLCRDGRDVAKSFQQRGWYGPWLHDNVREWNEALDYRERWRSLDRKCHFLDVHYEDLVIDTERTVRGICSFLGEQFEPQMLAWQSRVDDLIPAREMPIHEKLRRAPAATDVNRWRHEMSTRELFVSEAFMGRHLEQAGYERNFKSPLWAPLFQLTRWYCIVGELIARLSLKGLRRLRKPHFHQPSDLRRIGGRE